MPLPRLAQGGRWRIETMRSLRESLLLWFTYGQGRITVSGTTRGYGPHNAIFIPAGTMHGFEMPGRVFGTAVFFGRDCDLPLPDVPLHLRIREAHAQKEITVILDAAQSEVDGQRPASERALEHHMGLLSVWLERQHAATPPDARNARPDAAKRLADRYSRLLERDYNSGMTVAAYAAALGVTPTHLTRACKSACARTAHAILQERVLYEARELLAGTRMPIKDIAQHLGFTSPAYFTRAFQNQTGHTPSAFRQKH